MKEVERILLISLALSSLALVLAVICFPLLHFNLGSLTEMVHKDMDEFKGSSDTLWKDLMEIEETVSARERREDYVYKYKPKSHKHSHRKAKKARRLSTNRSKQRRHPVWGKRVVMGIKGSLPRTNTHRVHAAPTVEVKEKPGKKVFSDSEYIGAALSPMESKETEAPQKCEMKLVPNPKCAPGTPGAAGVDGEDGVDGQPGTDGLDGESPTEPYQEQTCIQCPEGEPGIKGPPGPLGDPGEQGPRGIPGILKELPGPRGPVGEVGAKGEQGVPGPRGQMGVSVKKWICPPGDKGPTGPKGLRGENGPQGDRGEMGIQGVSGRKGPIGKEGLMGEVGVPGPAGAAGRLGFEEHYCQCPERSKGVRGKFTLPQVPNYVTPEEEEYPKNVFADRFLQ